MGIRLTLKTVYRGRISCEHGSSDSVHLTVNPALLEASSLVTMLTLALLEWVGYVMAHECKSRKTDVAFPTSDQVERIGK